MFRLQKFCPIYLGVLSVRTHEDWKTGLNLLLFLSNVQPFNIEQIYKCQKL